MTDKKLEELRAALNSVGLVLLRVEENTRIDLDYKVPPGYAEYLENKTQPETSIRKRVYIDAAPLLLSASLVPK
jgi:hypothetical protein